MICCLKLEYHCWYSNFKHYPIIDSGLISQQKKVYCNEVPKTKFADGIKKTIQWYLDHEEWWRGILSGEYRLERLGTNG